MAPQNSSALRVPMTLQGARRRAEKVAIIPTSAFLAVPRATPMFDRKVSRKPVNALIVRRIWTRGVYRWRRRVCAGNWRGTYQVEVIE